MGIKRILKSPLIKINGAINQWKWRNTWRYFSYKFKTDPKYQRAEPSIIAKYKSGTYHKGYFCGDGNINLKIITCEDNIVIMSKIQS